MSLTLYAHPFSSYCQKVLVAFYENDLAFEFRLLGPENTRLFEEFTALWPMQRMPVLVDGDRTIVESSIIIEHLGLRHPGPVRLIPADPATALEARMMDRFFDNYVMTPMQTIVFNYIRTEPARDPYGVEQARKLLDKAYLWLEKRIAGRDWAMGSDFSIADCAAGPALFYADWVHPVPSGLGQVREYRKRLLARRSFARAVDEARPYRKLFPPGAPDRD